jgi:hypothetical protein
MEFGAGILYKSCQPSIRFVETLSVTALLFSHANKFLPLLSIFRDLFPTNHSHALKNDFHLWN